MALAQIHELMRVLRGKNRSKEKDFVDNRMLNDRLKKFDLSKLEAKDITIEKIAEITGLEVSQLKGTVPNRRFKEHADWIL